MKQYSKRMLISACVFFIFPSCTASKLQSQLAEHESAQQKATLNLSRKVFNQRQTPITWNQAVSLIHKNNLTYAQSLKSIEDAKRSKKRLWTDLIPDIFIYTNISKSITELADISSDDFNTSIISNLNIPSPLNFYARAYGAALLEVQANLSHELQRRQLQASLYSFFLQQQHLSEASKEITKLSSEINSAPIGQISQQFQKLRTQQQRNLIAKERFRITLNEFFNTPGHNWLLIGNPPKLDYDNKIHHLDLHRGFGMLGLKLQALEIEYSHITLWKAKVASWPRVNFSLSSPSLYSSSSDEGVVFDPNQFRLFSGISESFSFDDPLNKENMRDAKYRFRVSRERLLIKAEREVSQLAINKKAYSRLMSDRDKVEQTIKKLQSASTTRSPALLQEEINKLNALNTTLSSIESQLTQLKLIFWIWDDQYWKNH